MTKPVATILCAALSVQCAGVRAMQSGSRVQAGPISDAALVRAMADRIPPGSRVRVTLAEGRQLKAILIGVDDGNVVIRERTRMPEPPIRIPADRVTSIELENGGGLGKAIAIGAAIGVGITMGILMLLAAAVAD